MKCEIYCLTDSEEIPSVGAVLTTITEMCPTHGQRGLITVADEAGEDCNAFEAVKHYKLMQRTSEASTCDCGQKLRPIID